MERTFDIFPGAGGQGLVKAWTRGVAVEAQARAQVERMAAMPFVFKHVAVMPDVHLGMGATVGSVIPTVGAIIPAAVGVDIGCGMVAVRTSMTSARLPDSLGPLRSAIEASIPHGRTANGGPGDRGAWGDLPDPARDAWAGLSERFDAICEKHPSLRKGNQANHLGTLGTGNHFVEVCLDESDRVWLMLHSGSRGVGNRIGSYFIERAKREMEKWHIRLPDADLAYLPDGTPLFGDYIRSVGWAQDFARANRKLMVEAALRAMREVLGAFETGDKVVDCHHNYVTKELHFGEEVFVTRKGAVRAGKGELGIIPGSMGARSFIVCGKGHPESFCSCSHGAGRAMSRTEARRRFSVADHVKAVAGVECRTDADVVDETPAAYKPIDAVMAAQADLVDIVHELRQVVCVKG
jgi:tRNA-splicing ligase RtcB